MRTEVVSLSSVFLLISLCAVSQTSGELRNSTGCGAGGAQLFKIQGGSPVGPWPWLCVLALALDMAEDLAMARVIDLGVVVAVCGGSGPTHTGRT